MSLRPKPGVGEQEKKTAKAKEKEVMDMAMAETKTEAERPRFKEKMGSVFPKKRRSVKRQIFDYLRHLLGLTCADQTSQVKNDTTTAPPSAALFPGDIETNITKAKRVYPHAQLHGYKYD